MSTDRTNLNSLTEQIIGCAFTVANAMKCGFSEKVYENSLAHELVKNGLLVQQQLVSPCIMTAWWSVRIPAIYWLKARFWLN
jgi:hypothetical protein